MSSTLRNVLESLLLVAVGIVIMVATPVHAGKASPRPSERAVVPCVGSAVA